MNFDPLVDSEDSESISQRSVGEQMYKPKKNFMFQKQDPIAAVSESSDDDHDKLDLGGEVGNVNLNMLTAGNKNMNFRQSIRDEFESTFKESMTLTGTKGLEIPKMYVGSLNNERTQGLNDILSVHVKSDDESYRLSKSTQKFEKKQDKTSIKSSMITDESEISGLDASDIKLKVAEDSTLIIKAQEINISQDQNQSFKRKRTARKSRF